jgi:hypothetical protein
VKLKALYFSRILQNPAGLNNGIPMHLVAGGAVFLRQILQQPLRCPQCCRLVEVYLVVYFFSNLPAQWMPGRKALQVPPQCLYLGYLTALALQQLHKVPGGLPAGQLLLIVCRFQKARNGPYLNIFVIHR